MNIEITSTQNSIQVEFNDYYPSQHQYVRGTWLKNRIQRIELNSYITIAIEDEKDWLVSFDNTIDTFQIDFVNGQTPISNEDLYNKIVGLMG